MSTEVAGEIPDVDMAASTEPAENGAPMEEASAAAPQSPKGRKMHPSGRTVIVKNLPASMLFTFNEDLKELLGKYGEINYIKRGGITVEFQTVDPTLTAYVSFESAESSEKCLQERGTILKGNAIEMEILRAGEHTVVVSNLPFVISSECIRNLMAPCGAIKEVVKIPARPTAFIEFEEEEGLNKALTLNGNMLINNVDVVFGRRGTDEANKPVKVKLTRAQKKAASNPKPRGNFTGPRGGPGRGRGGFYMPGTWDEPSFPFRPLRGGFNGGNMNFGNNWGNGNFSDNERAYKRRKQNNWVWQY